MRALTFPAVVLIQLAIAPAIEAASWEPDRVAVILHGSRSAYDSGQSAWGYGAGGSIAYYSKQHLRYWLGVDRDRIPPSGSLTITVTATALGVEFGPRRPHRAEPYSRFGFGIYSLAAKTSYPDLITGAPTTLERHKSRPGLNFSFGGRVRPGRSTVAEVGVALHDIFAGEQSEAPNLSTTKLLHVHAGLGYAFH